MVWRNIFRTSTETGDDQSTSETSPPATSGRTLPSHLAEAMDRRSANGKGGAPVDPELRKLAGLRRQRQAILYEIKEGHRAAAPDNPWTNRAALLTEALSTVSDDIASAGEIVAGPFHPVSVTPIAIETIDASDPATVKFSVASERFAYEEDPDWAERGHQISLSELVRRSGSVETLIPADTPPQLHGALGEHLDDSLFVFASDLRDRALAGDSLPVSPTLADLAAPCPVCGGWTDWRGTCQSCARRQAHLMSLKREESRLLDERARELEERHRLVEGLSLARTRLRDVEASLARLGETLD